MNSTTEYRLRQAYKQFRREPITAVSVHSLASEAAKIAGWSADSKGSRVHELVWELGLILERKPFQRLPGKRAKKPSLTAAVFVRYVASLDGVHRCIPLEIRKI